jgi:hypothetical protein
MSLALLLQDALVGPLVAFKYGLTHRCIVEASHHCGDNNETDGTSGGGGDGGGGVSCDVDDGSLSYRQLVFSHTLLLHRVAAMTNFRLEGPWNLAPLLKRRGMAGPQQAKTWAGERDVRVPDLLARDPHSSSARDGLMPVSSSSASPSPAPSPSSCKVIPVVRRNEMTVRTGKWLWDWEGMEKVCTRSTR